MSADDFQSKCASVMETMIKSAISETTKLFETMVNELKTDISKIKKENELLKIRCSNYEKTNSQVTPNTQGRHPNDGSEKRDTAVQCDLVPHCTLLMKQHQPSLKSQEEQCCYKVMEDNLAKDQCCGTHEDGNSEMTYVHVKSEEETEDTRLGQQVISYNADSLPTSAETEVPPSDQDCSDGEMTKDGDSQLAMELPCLEMDISGQGAQNQLSEPEQSVVASVSAMNKDMGEDTGVGLKISEIKTHGELLTTKEKHFEQYTGVHPSEEQPKPSTLHKEKYCEEFQRGMTPSSIFLRRGQPSIKVKQQQKPDKEIILISSTDVPADQEVNGCPSIRMGQAKAFAAVDKVNITSAEVSDEFRENNTSVTLQDAILLVQAMNQTKVDDTIYTRQINTPPQTQFVCNDVSPQSEQLSAQLSSLPVPSQTPPPPVVKDNLPIAALCTTQSTVSTLCGTSLMTDTPKTNTSHSHIKVVTFSNTTTSTSSTPVMSASLKIPHINSVPNTIIVVPRSLSSVMPHSISPLSPTQISTVVSKVAAAKNIASLPASTAMGLITPSLSSVTQKTAHVTARKSSVTTIGLTDEQSGIQQCPKITIVVSRQMLARARKRQAQTKLSTTLESVITSTTFGARQFAGSSQGTKICQDGNESLVEVITSSSSDCAKPLSIGSEFSENTTEEEPSSVDTLRHSSKKIFSVSEVPALLTHVNPNLEETSISRTLNTPQMSGNSSETLLEEALGNSRMKPLAPFPESVPVPVKSTLAINTPEFLAKSHTAREPTCNLDEEKHSDAAIQLSSITSADLADPRLQMSKKQFLAQLAVSPVVQAQQQSSTHEVPDAPLSCAETSMCNKRKLQGNSLMERLRGHLKYDLQVRGTKTKQEPVEETEISDITSKKPRLENVCPNERETTSEPIHVRTKKTSVSLKRITNANPRMKSGIYEDDIGLENTVDKPKATNVNPRQLRTTKDSSSTKANSPHLNSRILRSRKIGFSPQNSKVTSVTALKTRLSVDISGSNMSQTSSPRSFTSSKDGTYPVNINPTSVGPRSSRSKKSAGSKKWNACSGSDRKVDSSENDKCCRMTCPKNSDHAQRCGLSKNEDNSPKIPTVGVIEDFSCTRRSNRASTFLSVKNGFPCTKLAKDRACQRQAGESNPAKKFRLLQECAIPKRNASVVNAKKLAKAAKAKTIEKIKKSKLQSEASATYLAINATSCEVVKRCKAKAVWTPPKMPASKINSLGGRKSSLLAVKNNTQSPSSLYSASVSLHTIPVRTTQIISPLQPLSVIGRHLLKNQCGECGRVLSSSASLESHVSLHTGHRPFSCTLCGKSFPDSKGLKRHGRVHRNGRIHICQQCGKGFVYRFGLTKHIQMVHGRIKPFVCQMCSKAFFTKRDVEAHIRIHTGEKPFHCHLCEKRFARRVELNVHLRWHNGEKRHWCPYCGKGFLDFNNLKRHKYIHTGEKPHSCPNCPKHFTQSGHLKKHLKNVHKIH